MRGIAQKRHAATCPPRHRITVAHGILAGLRRGAQQRRRIEKRQAELRDVRQDAVVAGLMMPVLPSRRRGAGVGGTGIDDPVEPPRAPSWRRERVSPAIHMVSPSHKAGQSTAPRHISMPCQHTPPSSGYMMPRSAEWMPSAPTRTSPCKVVLFSSCAVTPLVSWVKQVTRQVVRSAGPSRSAAARQRRPCRRPRWMEIAACRGRHKCHATRPR